MNESIGQQLRQAREARSLTLEQVAQATRMRLSYIKALEAGDFKALPSMTQARGFLRSYAAFLNLDAEALLRSLDGQAEVAVSPSVPAVEMPAPSRRASVNAGKEAFKEIGQTLHRQRELLGLSLEDVERHTHLRQHYLRALEAGELDDLPSPVQGRGMLSNYAAFLGLDSEPLLLRFAEGLQARLTAAQTERAAAQPVPTRRKKPLPAPVRRLFSPDILIGGTLTIVLVAAVAWIILQILLSNSSQPVSPTAPSIADVLLASPTIATLMSSETVVPAEKAAGEATATPPALLDPALLTSTQSSELLQTPVGQQTVQVYVTVRQRSWMRVIVDGKVEFEGRVIPGSAYSFAGKSRVEILTGNGAGLQVFFNQQDLGLMGLFGQVVYRIYTLQGVITPTPSVTLTPTPTARLQPATPTMVLPNAGTATSPALP